MRVADSREFKGCQRIAPLNRFHKVFWNDPPKIQEKETKKKKGCNEKRTEDAE